MLLEKINYPNDLKNLNIKQLELLSQEIRERIIEVVSSTGGHLASSLGAVELAIALHYCLNTPQDILIWDVGHQAYAHKILTGRNKDFQTLRQFKGISGFPNKDESIYDPFSTGHSSTAVSLALGEAIGRDRNNKKNKVAAVIGDGSLTGGLCFEALNHAGHLKKDILVILNSNEMAISPSVGALSSYLNKIISAPIYNRLRSRIAEELEVFTKKAPRLGRFAKEAARRFEEGLKNLIVPGIFFEELGFRYFGPLDGHNLELLIHTLKNIIDLKGPILLHVITKKGKGYEFAEKNPVAFHSSGPFDIKTGVFKKKDRGKTVSSSEIFGKRLVELAKTDQRIVAISAAMAEGTGLREFRDTYPDRFFDVGIAEQHAVSLAAGLSKEGLKPVVAIYSTFLQRAYDQIIEELALQKTNCILAIDRAGLVGDDGPTHHGLFDIAYLRHIPNLVIMAPSFSDELEQMLDFALDYHGGPIAIRYPKYITVSELKARLKIELGRACILREGADVAIIALGSMVDVALEAAQILFKEEGISSAVIDARFVKPLDIDLMKRLFSKTNLIFSIEDSVLAAGFGSSILEALSCEETLREKVNALQILGLADEFISHGNREFLLNIYGLSPQAVAAKVKSQFVATRHQQNIR